MDGKIILRVLSALILIVAVAGIAFLAFQAGFAQAAVANAPAAQAVPGHGPIPYSGLPFGWHAFPFFGFGCFGPLLALFLIFIAFRAVGFLFWGARWRHWGHGYPGWGHGGVDEGGVPPMFREWHERAHKPVDSERKV